jgi:hypothetical protein
VTSIRRKVLAGIVIIGLFLIFFWTCTDTQAQITISLQPSDKFRIPSNNGAVNFAVNGTYSKATFENDTWIFENLHLAGSQLLANFTFSTQNSNVTISSYRVTNGTSFQTIRLRCVIEGQGKQILNLGLGSQGEGWRSSLEWNVVVTGAGGTVFLAQGDGWTISHDGTIVINGASGNVSVVHYNFLGNGLQNSNLPFYQQHSLAIATTAAVAIIFVIAVVTKIKNKEAPKKSEQVKIA